MLELDLQKKIIKRLRELDGIWLFKAHEESTRGIPDIVGCYKGRFFAIEVKRSEFEKSSSRALQEYNLEKIRKCNGLGFIWWPENWEEHFENFFLQKNKPIRSGKKARGERTNAAKCSNRIYTQKDLYD